MGVIGGTMGIIIGLILFIFSGGMAKFLRFSGGHGGKGASSGLVRWKKENGKSKIGMAGSVEDRFGERKAKIIVRVIGLILIIASTFAFFNSQGI